MDLQFVSKGVVLAVLGLVTSCGSGPGAPTLDATRPRPDGSDWRLVWRDEFTARVGPDWSFDVGTGAGGWGNNELEYYTARSDNARVENGNLVIEARKERYRSAEYTSARMRTEGRVTFKYGRIEARMQLPRGQGVWPAFWALGDTFRSAGWPKCGEIDIMENIGREPGRVHGAVHGPGYSGGAGVGGFFQRPAGGAFADGFHVFAIEWDSAGIRWFADGTPFKSIGPADVPAPWIFDRHVFLILNLAIGGNWPGNPDEATIFPQSLKVDYVRVYQK